MDKSERTKAVLTLITSHFDADEIRFREVASEIANQLDRDGKGELAHHIYAQMGWGNTFSPGGGELPTHEEDVLNKLIAEFEDAVWCSRGEVLTQNTAAKKRAEVAKKSLQGIFHTYAERYASAKLANALDNLLRNKAEVEDSCGDTVDIIEVSQVKKMRASVYLFGEKRS